MQATVQGERGLTMEPLYQGEPILAVAAVDELTAAEAIEAIEIEFEPLPFVVDPIEGLRPGSPNARCAGQRVDATDRAAGGAATARSVERRARRRYCRRPARRPRPAAAKPLARGTGRAWFAAARAGGVRRRRRSPSGNGRRRTSGTRGEGQMPLGKATDEWTFGDVDEALKKADLVLDETFMTQSTGHQPLETRSAMAYWQNGKLYLHGSTQSTVQTVASVARWVGIAAERRS